MIVALIKRGNLDTNIHTGRTPCEHESRDRDDIPTTKKHQKLLANYQKCGKGMEQTVPESFQEVATLPTPASQISNL